MLSRLIYIYIYLINNKFWGVYINNIYCHHSTMAVYTKKYPTISGGQWRRFDRQGSKAYFRLRSWWEPSVGWIKGCVTVTSCQIGPIILETEFSSPTFQMYPLHLPMVLIPFKNSISHEFKCIEAEWATQWGRRTRDPSLKLPNLVVPKPRGFQIRVVTKHSPQCLCFHYACHT